MIAIVDNDVIAKLARFGLLDAFVAYLNKKKFFLQLQPTIDATFDLAGKGTALKKVATVAQRDKIAGIAAKAGRIELNDEGKKLVEACHLVEGLDAGDGIWASVAASTPESIVFSGDKRAIRALARDPACAQIFAQLKGRVVCLEQIVIDLFEEVGYPVVRNGVRADAIADLSTSSAFPDQLTKRADATAALVAQIEALRKDVGPLLRP